MNRFSKLVLPAVVSSVFLFSGYAQAMGGSSDEFTPPTCPKGQIYDQKTKTCMVDKGGMIGDETRTDYAYALAKTGRYQEALDMLNTLQ